jgi:hypothetical protein
MAKVTYEESIPLIAEELKKRKSKWRLTSLAWMDFHDVEQRVLLHLFKKWDKWDQEKPLLPWLNTVIQNQIINIVRNNYSNYARPCLKCPHNMGGNLCDLYGKQSSQCKTSPIPGLISYQKWEKSKKHAYDVKLAVSISDERIFGEGNEFDARASDSSSFDFEGMVPKIHLRIQEKLTVLEQRIYDYLFIQNLSEDETIKEMGYTNGTTKTGYKLVKKIRGQIIVKAKELISEMV